MNEHMKYKFELTTEELQTIMDALMEMPFKKVNMTINRIYQEVERQNNERMKAQEVTPAHNA